MRMRTCPTVPAGEETWQYIYCYFCDDPRSWSRAVKIAASREPPVKITAAKPPRKSWLAAIFTAQCTLVHMRGLGIACRLSVCPSVRLSVRLSVCL